jgi:hypothetical protein
VTPTAALALGHLLDPTALMGTLEEQMGQTASTAA